MDEAGAQEMITPVLHPLGLWQETNRTNSAGFELMRIDDRRGASFALGGTAEEMFVDLVRKFQISYKDLPLNLYQFSSKFRDELRVRGGLLRVREFLMKDAYSFHTTEEDFKREYATMLDTYTRIFSELRLNTIIVESDNGYIGGEYCHEFIVESQTGESTFLTTEDGSYAAHEDVAVSITSPYESAETMLARTDVYGENTIGVQQLSAFLNIPVEKTTKTMLFETEKGEVIAAAIRGDLDINEAKLQLAVGCHSLQLASPDKVKDITGAEVGYAGVLNLPPSVRVFYDKSTKGRVNFEMGANKTHYHTINVNFGRDLPEPGQFYEFKLAKSGDLTSDGKKLIKRKGVEVGNIFQLGYHYSSLMNANFVDENGQELPYYMGCYGIGIGRTLATVVEIHHDDRGIIWPESIAPYQVHLIGLNLEDEEVKSQAEKVYQDLTEKNSEVLYDDRLDISAGEKFADADLIGIPYRLVVSKKTGDQVEVKKRSESESMMFSFSELLTLLD
ncbi:MAG: Proline--tRNA ligase [Microgenomates bacterium OLB22]|nr:MAG: Proline--tRNA ligase [Microgenomates bacterium OLB22]